MPDQPVPATPESPPLPFSFVGDANRGTIRVDGGTVIGTYTSTAIELDLGWCWIAGIDVKVLDNARLDNHRGGVAFERKATD